MKIRLYGLFIFFAPNTAIRILSEQLESEQVRPLLIAAARKLEGG